MGESDDKKELDFKDIENGPMDQSKRQCRDLFCCILFIACVGAMVYFTYYAYYYGNPSLIYRGTDTGGIDICGQPGTVTADFPYVYFYDPTTLDLSLRYCVDQCPSYQSGALTPSALNTYTGAFAFTITIDQTGTYSGTPAAAGSNVIGYQSTAVIQRVCIPSSYVFLNAFNNLESTFASFLKQSDLSNFVNDVKNNWQWLLAAFGGAILISFIFMYALKCLAGCVVWVSIFGTIAFFIGAGIIFLYNAGVIPASASTYVGYLGIPSMSAGSNYAVYGYISFGIAGVFLIITLCCCSRIRLAVAVCKAAGQFVVGVCLIILVPIVQTLITLGLWAACLVAMVYLISAAKFVSTSTDVFTVIQSYSDPSLIRFYIFVFGTLWSNAIIQAIGTFVIASACCMWYYSHGPGQALDMPIFRSYKMAFRYHFGSLAFGSFILALVQFMQLIVQAFKKNAESSGAASNKCFEYAINCLRCCLACVERIVQFINKTAYIQIALRGKNFCMAAKDGFELVWSNALRYAIVAGVGQIMMFLGKVMIAAGTTVLFYLLITYVASIKANVLQPIYLLIIVFIMSYAVAMLFMAVYSLAMETLLACFIVDEQNQKGKGSKAPLYAPQELADLIDHD